jgi:hypothetical protein
MIAESFGLLRRGKPLALQALVDTGMPLTHLRFRCTNCGSRLTDFVVLCASSPPRGVTVTVQKWSRMLSAEPLGPLTDRFATPP